MSESLDQGSWEINRAVYHLDDVAAGYEAVWGVGRLESIIPADLARKWEAQKQKLDDAIQSKDVNAVQLLVAGCIRGYQALHDAAISAGHKPNEPTFWEIEKSGQVYRVCRNNNDAKSLHKSTPKNIIILSLSELIGLYDVAHKKFYATADKTEGEIKNKPAFDFEAGDSVPGEF